MDQELSAVAGITGPNGLRVIVARPSSMHHHVGPGERLVMLPGVFVSEPVPLERIAGLVARVQKLVAETQ